MSAFCFIIVGRFSDRRHLNAQAGKIVASRLEHLRSVKQRFGGDTADVEAGAAQRDPALDAGDGEAELARANGRVIAARAAADDDQRRRWAWRLRPTLSSGPLALPSRRPRDHFNCGRSHV